MHCGTVFSITTSGREKVLYSFGKHSGDGFAPYACLIDVVGSLYGTTDQGGAYGFGGYGTVFSVTTSGKERLLHSFGNGNDGALPLAGMIYKDGRLLGSTEYGGMSGEGVVFALTP